MDEITKKVIGTRINTALALRNVKQKDLAKHLKVSDNTISYFVGGSRTPNMEQLIKISRFLNVSTDYLLGLTKTASADTKIKDICEYTGLDEQAVETLHTASLPIVIDYDAELLEEELDSLDDERKKAEIQKSELFELINFFLVSPKFYEALKNLQKYLFDVANSSKHIEKSLNELFNKKITAKKFYEDDLCWIEIDITRKEKEDYNRLFYYEAVEALKNVVDNRCSRYIEDFEKAKLKMHYIYKSLFPINVSWSGITFGDIILGNYKELNETETKELDTIIEFLKQYFLDIRAGKEGETNAHNNEAE